MKPSFSKSTSLKKTASLAATLHLVFHSESAEQSADAGKFLGVDHLVAVEVEDPEEVAEQVEVGRYSDALHGIEKLGFVEVALDQPLLTT